MIGGWGLTELLNGSDASALTSNVKLVNGKYVLNGNKRWIGNANKVNQNFFFSNFKMFFRTLLLFLQEMSTLRRLVVTFYTWTVLV
jgi:hypothetical protein